MQQICRLIGRVNLKKDFLRQTDLQTKSNMHLLCSILLENQDQLAELTSEELYSLVVGHYRTHFKDSELLYLIEPHIMQKLDQFPPGQVIMLTNDFFMLGQGTLQFLNQVATYSVLKIERTSL